jgi:hypothetical protein
MLYSLLLLLTMALFMCVCVCICGIVYIQVLELNRVNINPITSSQPVNIQSFSKEIDQQREYERTRESERERW